MTIHTSASQSEGHSRFNQFWRSGLQSGFQGLKIAWNFLDAAVTIERLETALASIPFSAGVTAQVQGQSDQMNELFGNLVVALGLGGIFVYMVLASLFESLLLPLVVMAAIPMAAIGAFAALLIYGLPLDLYGGIGIVLLAGIVAKNSILLVDFAVARVREGQLTLLVVPSLYLFVERIYGRTRSMV